ncbi:hypothetical protein FRC03_011337 [Tulasnella sp. 419]|nr:hypothetical protein FRC03_011337 [Tulasnella sp. 419]
MSFTQTYVLTGFQSVFSKPQQSDGISYWSGSPQCTLVSNNHLAKRFIAGRHRLTRLPLLALKLSRSLPHHIVIRDIKRFASPHTLFLYK